jgi:putative DNA primase/helicase
MLAEVTDVAGKFLAIHRTYITADGSKAEVIPNKASLALIRGGAIRLDPCNQGKPLVIGEGIESSASAGKLIGAPAWAAISTAGLAKTMILPEEIRSIIIAADPGEPGERAATAAEMRWEAEGREVDIALPDGEGDFNDVLLRRTRR